jgi:very-short-patch-repair endonuclease
MENKLNSINWPEIQKFYDEGNTWRDVVSKFNISLNILFSASKSKLFLSRTPEKAKKLYWSKRNYQGHRHTEESKKKLSQARKAYLAANPDKCSWKNTDKFVSIPCEKLKSELKKRNIPFEYEQQPLLHIGRFYSTDISFPDYGAIIEINGGQHYDSNGNLKPYYQTRHDLLTQNGWRVFEIPYHVAMRENILDELLPQIFNTKSTPNMEYKLYKKKEHFCKCGNKKYKSSILCKKCNNKSGTHRKRKVERPSKEQLHWLIWNFPMTKIAKNFGVRDKSIKKWCNTYGLSTPNRGYWEKIRSSIIIDYQI